MTLQPLDDRVLLRPIKPAEQTKGGIIIPDSAQEKSQEAEVVAVGTDESLPVKVGDRVIYAKYSGTEIKLDGVEHIVVNRSDILGILKNGTGA